jgi:hypothetical protein
MYCIALKVYTCEEVARGPKTFLNMFCKLLHQNEPSPAWQWSWFQYQLTLLHIVLSLRIENYLGGNLGGESNCYIVPIANYIKMIRVHRSRYLAFALTVTSLPFLVPQKILTVTLFLMLEKSGSFCSLLQADYWRWSFIMIVTNDIMVTMLCVGQRILHTNFDNRIPKKNNYYSFW